MRLLAGRAGTLFYDWSLTEPAGALIINKLSNLNRKSTGARQYLYGTLVLKSSTVRPSSLHELNMKTPFGQNCIIHSIQKKTCHIAKDLTYTESIFTVENFRSAPNTKLQSIVSFCCWQLTIKAVLTVSL